MLPSISDVKKAAESGEYTTMPIYDELLSDIKTPVEVMKILLNVSDHCFMLESVSDNENWGRYTFLGFAPKLEITCTNGKMKINGTEFYTDNPESHVRKILANYKSPAVKALPSFTGGLVGYFSYDYMKYAEPSLRFTGEDQERFKDMDLMLFRSVIAFDNFRQKLILITNADASDLDVSYPAACAQLDRIAELLRHGAPAPRRPGRLTTPVKSLFSRERYCDMVERAKAHIREGDIFQVVLKSEAKRS